MNAYISSLKDVADRCDLRDSNILTQRKTPLLSSHDTDGH